MYKEWNKLTYKVTERKRRLNAMNAHALENKVLNSRDIMMLKEPVDSNPNLYLD